MYIHQCRSHFASVNQSITTHILIIVLSIQNHSGHNRCDHRPAIGDAIGDGHQCASEIRRQINVIDQKANIRSGTETDGQREQKHCHCGIGDIGQTDERDHRYPMADGVEQFACDAHGNVSVIDQIVGNGTEHDGKNPQHQVWQC